MLSLSSLHHLALSLALPPVLYLCFNLFFLCMPSTFIFLLCCDRLFGKESLVYHYLLTVRFFFFFWFTVAWQLQHKPEFSLRLETPCWLAKL